MTEWARLEELHEATRDLIEAGSEEAILDVAISTVEQVLGFGTNSVRRADQESETLQIVTRSAASERELGELPAYDIDGDAPAAQAYRTGETVLDECGPDDEYGRDPAVASLYVPLEDYGVLDIGRLSGAFTETDVRLAEILGDNIVAALRRAVRGQKVRELHTATQTLVRAQTKAEIARTAVEAAHDLLDFPLVTVLLYDEDADELRPVEYTDAVAELFADLPSVPPGEGIIGRAFETGEVEAHADVREDPAVFDPDTTLRSELVMPLGDHGVLICDSTEVGAFDETDVLLTRILAANVEAALDRSERERLLRERTREIERQNERLETFASVVSHDLRNPLNVAEGYLELAREGDDENLAAVARAHERMDDLIEDLLTLAREGRAVGEQRPTALSSVARDAWSNVVAEDASLTVEELPTISADEDRLQTLFENLFRNSVEHSSTSSRTSSGDAVEHGGPDTTVRVGPLADEPGFYVADDGPGIPETERERVFEMGYSAEGGTGLGLGIVATVADGHGWTVEAAKSASGGARFEIRGVDLAAD